MALTAKEEFEARWPKAGDRLFVKRAWAFDAQVVRDSGERSYRMPTGYKLAGDVLIDHAASVVVDRPNIIYAALFCYRQSVELFLKQIIQDFEDDPTRGLPLTHDLEVLWSRFMNVIDARLMRGALGLDAAAALVAELHHADMQSDAFRFTSNRSGQPFDFGDVGIDLANLRDVMQGLANFFEGCHDAFLPDDQYPPNEYWP